MRMMAGAGALLLLAGCATTIVPERDDIVPVAAIQRAAIAAPHAVPGYFLLHVVASGHQDGMLYLNSEQDYRDQRNLSVEVSPVAQAQLAERFRGDPERALAGHTIRVDGEVQRVRIDFLEDGRPSGKYYYQTHVRVGAARQVERLD